MANFFQPLNVVSDPDQLDIAITDVSINSIFAGAVAELLIDYANLRIALKVTGNLPDDGVTVKAVYSRLKDAWRDNATLIKFPFPMSPITDEQFEMVNGWNWDKTETSGTVSATTVELLRTGGWSVKNTAGDTTEEWASIITLGTLGDTDQVYYQQVNDETVDNTSSIKLFGAVNQAIQIYRDDNGDGIADFNYRSFFKLFVREWQKTYASSNFGDIGVTTATFQAYRFPLTNTVDLKVTHAEDLIIDGLAITAASGDGTTQTYTTGAIEHGLSVGEIITVVGMDPVGYNVASVEITAVPSATQFSVAGSETGLFVTGGTVVRDVYGNVNVTFLRDSAGDRITNEDVLGDWATAQTYVVGNVVKGSDGNWYEVTVAGASPSAGDSSDLANGSDTGSGNTYVLFDGQREIAGVNYPFTIIIDGDTTTAAFDGGSARTTDIYERIQYYLRQASDIDADGTGVVIGKTANGLLNFVGDTLVTSTGVYIDSFSIDDINSIEFNDAQNTTRVFNFIATLTVNFGTNLQNDEFAKYFVFFTNDSAADAPAGADYGTVDAILVEDNDGVVMGTENANTNLVNPAWPTKRTSVNHSYDYDGNIQRGAGSEGKDAPITVVGIGLSTGQYVSATGTIQRSKANSVSLVAALERNYSEGTVAAV